MSEPPPSLPRVLVVDDEEIVRQVLARALADVVVVEASGAEEALDLMVEAPVDLVITDIALRRMDGCAFAARMRERWPEVPILAISGYVDDRDVAEFEFDGFLQKPIDIEQLRRLVREALPARDA